MKLAKGLIQIYTGNGKGKTTAAIGQAMRAQSHGFKIAFVQFIKAGHDQKAIKLIPDVTYYYFGLPHEQFGWLHHLKPGTQPNPTYLKHLKTLRSKIYAGWQKAVQLIESNNYDIIVLDELNLAFYFNLLTTDEIIKVLKNKPTSLEIIITGRQAPPELIKIADLVTDMTEVKHPYKLGIIARKGIEY